LVGTTSLSSLGHRDILVREGIHPPETLRVDGAAEVYPGFALTSEGHTFPDVAKPDAAGDSVTGVAGLLENQDIDTVYADDAEIPVYLCGSGAIVWCYHGLNDGSIVKGDILCASAGNDTGYVRPFSKALHDVVDAGSAGGPTVLATQILCLFTLMGRAMETHASTGTTVTIKVLLSI